MNRNTLFNFIKETYGVDPDYPWVDGNAVVRHTDTRKWFGLVMNISTDKIGLFNKKRMDVLNVKCDPTLIGSLRCEKGFYPAYHMNKNSWITIDIKEVDEDEIKMLIDMSYKLTKRVKK